MQHASGLRYHGSTVEVSLGDVVEMHRFLRRPLRGVVCYIPGISAKHPDLEYDDVQQWAIRGENGAVYPIAYAPERFQPPSGIRFIARGRTDPLDPNDSLE